ncbi:MAG: hypothetical protein J3K34DRAFT_442513 [Monoraphidium minutum]|nr:MAG: hypothetical protein J3K34DRAFT_442513 [Monoraphidium minutum]
MAAAHAGATCAVISGRGLLDAGYPLIHAVGRASARPPCLIDINWAPPGVSDAGSLPLLALVGKGVCFDSGGLNLKSGAGMKTMKKDMGGAALVLALAHVVMSRALPLRLRVLVPAVENSVSGSAYRPMDVLTSRAGITVEQGNCDAEGRLVLADALAEAGAAEPPPDLIVDAATLTGAARAALGPELPAVFSRDEAAWAQLEAAAADQADPLWRLPLHPGYRRLLDSKIADTGSVSAADSPQGGAIVAALFLDRFVPPPCQAWLHIDTGAWVGGGMARPGRPDGGEALGLFALTAMLEERYGGCGRGGGGGGGGGGAV